MAYLKLPQLRFCNDLAFVLGLFGFVVASRALTSGPVYFADGPRHLAAIADRSYVIQPPGYWLFNRLGGLFPNPEHALLTFNWIISALGAVLFYRLALRLTGAWTAKLGAVLYSIVFFAWFAGDVHSTYASQLCFPVLLMLLMLQYIDKPSDWQAVAIGLCFSVTSGFRPSDGVFLAPLLLFFALRYQQGRKAAICLGTAVVGCLLWWIPNTVALHRYSIRTDAQQLNWVAQGSVLLGRVNAYTAVNTLRFLLPLILALGPLLPFVAYARSKTTRMLWIWALPASLFFLLLYISDAPYLDCVLAAFLLLGMVGLERKMGLTGVTVVLCVAIVINAGFYLFFHPLPMKGGTRLAATLFNKDVGMYTRYAVRTRMNVSIHEQLGVR